MDERLPPPWIAYPNARPDDLTPAQRNDVRDWLDFVSRLSPAGQRQYELDHPAPAGWEMFSGMASRRRQAREYVMAWGRQYELIARMWESTTLK